MPNNDNNDANPMRQLQSLQSKVEQLQQSVDELSELVTTEVSTFAGIELNGAVHYGENEDADGGGNGDAVLAKVTSGANGLGTATLYGGGSANFSLTCAGVKPMQSYVGQSVILHRLPGVVTNKRSIATSN